jgi:hypothetical protein
MTERKQYQPDPNEIGKLWKETSKKGQTYYTGKLNGESVVMFPVISENPKAPAFKIMRSTKLEQARQPEPQAPRFDDIPPINDNDIPF